MTSSAVDGVDIASLNIKSGDKDAKASENGVVESGDPKLLGHVKSTEEFSRAVIFDGKGDILASTIPNFSEEELRFIIDIFSDRPLAYAGGIVAGGNHFDVHRWHDDKGLIYGRRGESLDGEGVAVHKFVRKSTGSDMYMLVTYKIPVLSARAVPALLRFCQTHLETL